MLPNHFEPVGIRFRASFRKLGVPQFGVLIIRILLRAPISKKTCNLVSGALRSEPSRMSCSAVSLGLRGSENYSEPQKVGTWV